MVELANVVMLQTARAVHIRKLMSDMVGNTLAIGDELAKARETFPPGGPKNKRAGWATWLRNEFQMSTSWAAKLIQVHHKFGGVLARGGRGLPSQKVLAYLAQDNVPDAAREEAIEHIKKGKKLSKVGAKKLAAKHRPSPKQANKLAQETGKPVEASDGYVYLGATEQQVKESAQRRTIVYAVREAIQCISAVTLSAQDFLEYAAPHQLWKAREEDQIERALDWIKDLAKAWPKKREQLRK
jgi:hypothetical protein